MRLRSQPVPAERLAVSIDEAAAMAGLGKSAIKAPIATGELAVVKIGTRTLIMVEDLQNFLQRHRITRANGSGSADPPAKATAPPRRGAEGPALEQLLHLRVDELDLGGRLRGVMADENIVYLHQLVALSETDLMRLPNVGRISIARVKKLLAKHRLKLGMDIAAPDAGVTAAAD
jgi:excisionase family DNA binding protein